MLLKQTIYKYIYTKRFSYAGFILAPVVGFGLKAVDNPFIQFVSEAQLYSQMQLSLQNDPIFLVIPSSTY